MPATRSERRWPRLPVPGWLGRHGPTLRLRLTLLYGGCFLIAGTALLGITYELVSANNTLVGPRRYLMKAGSQASGVIQANVYAAVGGSPRLIGAAAFTQTAPAAAGQVRFVGPGFGLGLPLLFAPLSKASPLAQGVNELPPFPSSTFLRSKAESVRRALQTYAGAIDRALVRVHTGTLSGLLIESGVALAIMALLSVGFGWWLAGRALRPLRTMNSRARRITEHNLHERLAVDTRPDELGELAASFDGLLGRLERAFAAQRRFVANASHELRTPITLQRALVEVTLADPDASAGELRHACERVLAAGEQQERLIEALLALARGQAGSDAREPVDLAVLAGDLLEAREFRTRALQVDAALEPAVVTGDPALLERLIANLLDNAIVHNALIDGWIRVRTGTIAGRAILRIANRGPEIPEGRVGELFEPFRRLAGDRAFDADGLGLGLSIVQAIAVAHGASVDAEPLTGGGLSLEVSFPAAPAVVPGRSAQPSVRPPVLRATAGNSGEMQGD